jgi:hypothetical protein
MRDFRVVKTDGDGPEPPDTHISHDAVRRKLEVLLAKNPISVMFLFEIDEKVHNDCVPDSVVMRRGLVREIYDFYEGKDE